MDDLEKIKTGLTVKQDQVWRFITQYTQMNGRSPTLEEIADAVDLRAVSTVHKHLDNLRKLGLISKIPHGKRAIMIKGAPKTGVKIENYKSYKIFHGSKATKINASFPLVENLEQPIIGLEVGDNAYEKNHIKQGDWLIVHETKRITWDCFMAIELINEVILIRKAINLNGKTVFKSLDSVNQIEPVNVKMLGKVLRLIRKF